jgi:hypothetical protein
MSNLELYEKVRSVPENAQKKIEGGRLKGMTDINPMWRIKVLTENFGICGIGWKIELVRTWIDNGVNGESVTNVEIKLYVKVDDKWSDGIIGVGGAKFIAKESGGLYTDDEALKKAYTDAISVACKSLGIGADVYFSKDGSKYDTPNEKNKDSGNQQKPAAKKTKYAIVNELIKDSSIVFDDITEWIIKKFGGKIKINDLTDEQFEILIKALKRQIEAEMEDE